MSLTDTDAVALLTEVVATPSLCGQEDGVAGVLLGAMRAAGLEAARDEAGNVVGSVGPQGAPEVVILGHMDTVPGDIAVEQREGALHGRGAVDAKGPLVTGLVAAVRAAPRLQTRVTVIGAVQEEGPSAGARHLVCRPAPDYLIIAEPSSWNCVVLGYKGSQRFTVRFARASGHTSGPDATASERAFAFWLALCTLCQSQSRATDAFYSLTPTLIGMESGDDGMRDTAALHISLRLPPGLNLESVRGEVQALAPDGEFTFAPGEEAVRGDKRNSLVAAFLRSIRAEGGTPRFKVKTGTSDMNVVGPVWRVPMVAYGPGDSRLDHTPHEHVSIEEFLRAVRVVTRVLEDLR